MLKPCTHSNWDLLRGMTGIDRLCERDATKFGVLKLYKNENKRPPIYLRGNVGAPRRYY